MQLTDAQVMTFVIAIIVPLSLLIYSNSRDAKETLRAETAKLGVELRSEMKDIRSEIKDLRKDMNAGFERIENALKLHVLEHHS